MKNKIANIRSVVLKSNNEPNDIMFFCENLQKDYEKYFPLVYSWTGNGYTRLTENNTPVFIEPTILDNSFHDEKVFIKMFSSTGTDNSSCYNLFDENYKSNQTSRFTKERLKWIKSEGKDENGQFKQMKGLEIINDWESIFEKTKPIFIQEGEKGLKTYWEKELGKQFVCDNRKSGTKLRIKYNVQCKYPNNHMYCVCLADVIGNQLRSQNEKYHKHLQELSEIKVKIDSFVNEHNYKLLKNYADDLKSIDSRLTKYVIQSSNRLDKIKKTNIQRELDVLKQDKHKEFLNLHYSEKIKHYKNWRIEENYNFRISNRKYIKYPDLTKNCKIHIPKNYFSLTKEENKLFLLIDGFDKIECMPSAYFNDFELKEGSNCYEVSYNHRVKRKKNVKSNIPEVSQKITGKIKQIGLQVKNGELFVTLPVNLDLPEENINNYFYSFCTSKFDDKLAERFKKLPDEINVVGVDLGISYPLSVTLSKIARELKDYDFKINNYGFGKIIEQKHLIQDSKICKDIQQSINNIHRIKSIIKEFKSCQKENKDLNIKKQFLSEESMKWLGEQIPNLKHYPQTDLDKHFRFVRRLIDLIVSMFRDSLVNLKSKLRSTGYENISEMIQLTRCMDVYNQLISSYKRIHLKENEFLYDKPNKNNKRPKFKLFVIRRIAATLVRYCLDNNVKVVFLEDLDMKQDSDKTNNDNSLIRLFTPRLLIDTITMALHKYGICVISSVDPKGTSKIVWYNNTLGVRGNEVEYLQHDNPKRLLIVKNNKGKHKWDVIDCDLNASANILIKGLNRGIIPFQFFIKSDKSQDNEDNGKRLKVFLTKKYGTDKIYFYDNGNNLDAETKKMKGKENVVGRVYYIENTFFSEEQYKKIREDMTKEIEQDGLLDLNLDNFNITENLGKVSFQAPIQENKKVA